MSPRKSKGSNDLKGYLALKVCPRCGQPYNWLETISIGGRDYLYAVHVIKLDGGKRKKRIKHYLGPVDHYVYVSKLHTGIMSLKGLKEGDLPRVLSYLENIVDFLSIKLAHLKSEAEVRESMLKSIESQIQSEHPLSRSLEDGKALIQAELAERVEVIEDAKHVITKVIAQLEDIVKSIEGLSRVESSENKSEQTQ